MDHMRSEMIGMTSRKLPWGRNTSYYGVQVVRCVRRSQGYRKSSKTTKYVLRAVACVSPCSFKVLGLLFLVQTHDFSTVYYIKTSKYRQLDAKFQNLGVCVQTKSQNFQDLSGLHQASSFLKGWFCLDKCKRLQKSKILSRLQGMWWEW
jgi:hypothetical protein